MKGRSTKLSRNFQGSLKNVSGWWFGDGGARSRIEAVSESVVLVLLLEEWIGYMRGGYWIFDRGERSAGIQSAEERGCLRSSFLEERLAGTVKASHARPFRVTIRGNGQLCRSVNEACTSALSRHSRGNTPRKFFMVSSRPDFTHALCAARARFCSKPNCFISGCLSSSRVCAKIVQFVSQSLDRNLNGEISNWIMNKGLVKWMVENYFFKLSVIWCYCIFSKKSCNKKKHFSTIENLCEYINS